MIGFRASMMFLVPAVAMQAGPLLAAPPAAASHVSPKASGDVTRAQMIAESNHIFDRADTNHDGFMSRAEFAARMGGVLNANHPQDKAEAQRMLDGANRAFDDADINHDGKLSRAEGTARPLKAFDSMDANHDGVLTLAEKRAAYQSGPALQVGPTPDGPGR